MSSFLKWFFIELFNFNKTEQEKIDWNWFWKIEVPNWWLNTNPYKFFAMSKSFIKRLIEYEKDDEDEFPF